MVCPPRRKQNSWGSTKKELTLITNSIFIAKLRGTVGLKWGFSRRAEKKKSWGRELGSAPWRGV